MIKYESIYINFFFFFVTGLLILKTEETKDYKSPMALVLEPKPNLKLI